MKQCDPSNTDHYEFKEYKTCAGRECNNIGKNHLMILFINKSGWFCDSCRDSLVNLKLVKSEGLE
jgi:hypothetical protein